MEQACEQEQRGPHDRPKRCAARKHRARDQHRPRHPNLGSRQCDTVHVQCDANGLRADEDRRHQQIQPARPDCQSDRKHECQMIKTDDGVAEA